MPTKKYKPEQIVGLLRQIEVGEGVPTLRTMYFAGDRGRLLVESDEFKRLRRVVEKGRGDRDRAIVFVCRLYNVRTLDALPGAIQSAALALIEASERLTRISVWHAHLLVQSRLGPGIGSNSFASPCRIAG